MKCKWPYLKARIPLTAEYHVSLGYSQRQIREYPKYLLIPNICEKRLALFLMHTK